MIFFPEVGWTLSNHLDSILTENVFTSGAYHNLPIQQMHQALRDKFGDVVKIPGMLGRKDMLLTFDPVIFEHVFRTEGSFPVRRGLETFIYYRKKVRPDVFRGTGGLLSESGQSWLDVRSKVNPVLLQPKAVKMYVEKTDQVAKELIDRIKMVRNPETLEMPNTFGNDLKCWSLESIGVIALDERLGTMKGETKESQKIIEVKNKFDTQLHFPKIILSIFSLLMSFSCWHMNLMWHYQCGNTTKRNVFSV